VKKQLNRLRSFVEILDAFEKKHGDQMPDVIIHRLWSEDEHPIISFGGEDAQAVMTFFVNDGITWEKVRAHNGATDLVSFLDGVTLIIQNVERRAPLSVLVFEGALGRS
jgi:hypothetical protein